MDRSLFARLVIFYDKYRPENINVSILNEIIAKYGKNPAKMFQKLEKKYGEAPASEVSVEKTIEVLEKYGLQNEYNPPKDEKKTEAKKDEESDDGEVIASEPVATVLPGEEEGEVYIRRHEDVAQEMFLRSLDFLSPDFDPLFALTCDHPYVKASLPVPKAKPLDNISKCRFLLPETHEEYSDLGGALGIKSHHRPQIRSSEKLPSLDHVEKLADILKDGPYSVLYKCFTNKGQVSVMVRRVNSIRGVCTGYLKAYDRHMNLVLYDVEERYTMIERQKPPKKGKRKKKAVQKQQEELKAVDERGKKDTEVCTEESKKTVPVEALEKEKAENEKSQDAKLVTRSRRLKHILLRGDNVVMIWPSEKQSHVIPKR